MFVHMSPLCEKESHSLQSFINCGAFSLAGSFESIFHQLDPEK